MLTTAQVKGQYFADAWCSESGIGLVRAVFARWETLCSCRQITVLVKWWSVRYAAWRLMSRTAGLYVSLSGWMSMESCTVHFTGFLLRRGEACRAVMAVVGPGIAQRKATLFLPRTLDQRLIKGGQNECDGAWQSAGSLLQPVPSP